MERKMAFVSPIPIRLSSCHAIRLMPTTRTSFSSAFIPSTSYRRLSITQSPRHPRRVTPICHSSCHSHSPTSSSATAISTTSTSNALTELLSKISKYRSSLPVALTSTFLLIVSTFLHIFLPLSYAPLHLIPLSLTLVLSGLPALSDSVLLILRNRQSILSVNFLMTLAALAALFTSAIFEAALLTTLYTLSISAENTVSTHAQKHIQSLTKSANPETALLLSSPEQQQQPKKIPISQVKVNDLLLVQVGQQVPCDGVIMIEDGSCLVSMSQLTGESLPVSKNKNDEILAGSIPLDIPIILKVTRVSNDSFLSKISKLVIEGQKNQPSITSFFDTFGEIYTRTVLIISISIVVFLPILSTLFIQNNQHRVSFLGRNGSVMRGLGVLVVGSPCALLIGAPIAYTAALSCCAKKGVLVKGGAKALDSITQASHIIFDKTGTLTTGNLQLTNIHRISSSGAGELTNGEIKKVIHAAVALERGAIHPIAEAIRRKSEEFNNINNGSERIPIVLNARVISGQGVEGTLSYIDDDDGTIKGRLGKPSFIFNGNNGNNDNNIMNLINKEETISILQLGNEYYILRMKDDIRKEAKHVIHDLQNKLKFKEMTVLTGDTNGSASFVSESLSKNHFMKIISNATPEQKMNFIQNQQQHNNVLMIGDGVNDGAALATALVGISFGLTNSTSIEASDVVLVKQDLNDVTWLIRKARMTTFIVKQNLSIAILLMGVSAFACIYGAIPLWLAVLLHEGGTIFVGINGLRLLRH